MKKFMLTSILLTLFATGGVLMAQNRQQESLGLPGDNLNLYAVMKLFQDSETLEGFERSLNDPDNHINNLDLNGNNLVDYIRVIDDVDRNVHNIVLQVALDQNENQDVAVFTVQRNPDGRVFIQLTGDEALYGKDYIIEPYLADVDNSSTPNPGYAGNVTIQRTTTVELASWPLVRYIYLPTYRPWVSSWYFGYYPSYWHPWRPFFWDYYYGYHYNWNNDYYSRYRQINYHRYDRWNDYYYSNHRSYSPRVSARIQSGVYRNTYSRPDQRRKGEDMYFKRYPDQNRRSVTESSGNRNVRRSDPRSIQNNQSGGNTNARRSNTETNRSVSNPQRQSEQNQNRGTNRRSNTTVTDRSVSNPQQGQNNVSTSRSNTNTMTNRPATNQGNQRNTVNQRSSRQSTNAASNSSARRSRENNRAAAASKRAEKSKESGSKRESRRK